MTIENQQDQINEEIEEIPQEHPLGVPEVDAPEAALLEGDVTDNGMDEETEDGDFTIENLPSFTLVGPSKRVIQINTIRAILALGFVVVFIGVLTGAFLSLFTYGSDWEDAKELIQIILPTVSALLGSVVGFYFGSKEG